MIDLLHAIAHVYRSREEASPSPFEVARLQSMLYEESKRAQDLLLRYLVGASEGAPAGGDGGDLVHLLRRVQLAILAHPVAAQAAFAALMAEGRRFAATPEGAEWMAALAGSELAREGRRLWDALSMNLLEDDPATIVPSAYLEALLRAPSTPDLEALLSQLSGLTKGGERAAP